MMQAEFCLDIVLGVRLLEFRKAWATTDRDRPRDSIAALLTVLYKQGFDRRTSPGHSWLFDLR